MWVDHCIQCAFDRVLWLIAFRNSTATVAKMNDWLHSILQKQIFSFFPVCKMCCWMHSGKWHGTLNILALSCLAEIVFCAFSTRNGNDTKWISYRPDEIFIWDALKMNSIARFNRSKLLLNAISTNFNWLRQFFSYWFSSQANINK